MTNPSSSFNVRAHERFRLEPMYTEVTVRRGDGYALRSAEGHAYDVSEAGVRVELDDTLDVDEALTVSLTLSGESEPIVASARVVWINDEDDDPGPRRMAFRFTGFPMAEHRTRLIRQLGSGYYARAI